LRWLLPAWKIPGGEIVAGRDSLAIENSEGMRVKPVAETEETDIGSRMS